MCLTWRLVRTTRFFLPPSWSWHYSLHYRWVSILGSRCNRLFFFFFLSKWNPFFLLLKAPILHISWFGLGELQIRELSTMVRSGQSDYPILQQRVINPSSVHVNSSRCWHGNREEKNKFFTFGHNKICLPNIHSLTLEDSTTIGKNKGHI